MNAITIDRLSERAYAILTERARAHGATLEEEAAAVLEQATAVASNWRLEFADRIAATTPKGVVQEDSTAFIRAERDRE